MPTGGRGPTGPTTNELVVDATTLVGGALQGRLPAGTQHRRLIAPPLSWSEASSVLHQFAWRGDVDRERARAALDWLLAAPVASRAPARLRAEAWAVADRLGWAKTHDAEYVALARLEGCPLLTADVRLQRSASRLVEVVGPADL